jgi:hypothetical protein
MNRGRHVGAWYAANPGVPKKRRRARGRGLATGLRRERALKRMKRQRDERRP